MFGMTALAIGGIGAGIMGANQQSSATSAANEKTAEIAYATNAFNADQAQTSRNFLERMSDTTYQRTTADLKAAGLNPMLGFRQADPMPGGPTASGVSATMQPAIRNYAPAIQGGLNAAATAAGIQKTSADTDVSKAAKTLTEAQTVQSLSSAGQLDAQRDNIRQEMTAFQERYAKLSYETSGEMWKMLAAKSEAGIKLSEEDNAKIYYAARAQQLRDKAELLGLQVPEAIAQAAFWSSRFGQSYPFIERGGSAVGTIAGSAAKAAGLLK